MSMKLENKDAPGGEHDPFSPLGLAIERVIRKKKTPYDEDAPPAMTEAARQGSEAATPAQSKASSAAAAAVMSHWSEQKEPFDSLTTADRQRKQDKRRIINDPKSSEKAEDPKKDEPSKAQSVE